MCFLMPSPEELHVAPELAPLVSSAYALEATQLALAAIYPSLYGDLCDLDDDHTEQSAYARAVYTQIDALLPLVEGYLASARRTFSPETRRRRLADNISI
jgi:hypothetical protein